MKSQTGERPAMLPAEGFCTAEQISAVVLISPQTIRKLSREGSFPQPVRLPTKKVVWRVTEVRAWIDRQTFSYYMPSGIEAIREYRKKRLLSKESQEESEESLEQTAVNG